MWTWIVFASIAAAIALAFAIYNAQRGTLPGQRAELEDLRRELAQHQAKIDMLLDQGAQQWSKSLAYEKKLAEVQIENERLRQRTREQDTLILALQHQLAGLMTWQKRTSRRLRETLTKRLNETDLRAWAQDLNPPIEYENLAGDTLTARIISMLDTLERYGRTEEGLRELHNLRPDIQFDEV